MIWMISFCFLCFVLPEVKQKDFIIRLLLHQKHLFNLQQNILLRGMCRRNKREWRTGCTLITVFLLQKSCDTPGTELQAEGPALLKGFESESPGKEASHHAGVLSLDSWRFSIYKNQFWRCKYRWKHMLGFFTLMVKVLQRGDRIILQTSAGSRRIWMQLSHVLFNYFNHGILKNKRDIICPSVKMCLLSDGLNMFAFQTMWRVHVYFELYETTF